MMDRLTWHDALQNFVADEDQAMFSKILAAAVIITGFGVGMSTADAGHHYGYGGYSGSSFYGGSPYGGRYQSNYGYRGGYSPYSSGYRGIGIGFGSYSSPSYFGYRSGYGGGYGNYGGGYGNYGGGYGSYGRGYSNYGGYCY